LTLWQVQRGQRVGLAAGHQHARTGAGIDIEAPVGAADVLGVPAAIDGDIVRDIKADVQVVDLVQRALDVLHGRSMSGKDITKAICDIATGGVAIQCPDAGTTTARTSPRLPRPDVRGARGVSR
jgi:hypothetical protein